MSRLLTILAASLLVFALIEGITGAPFGLFRPRSGDNSTPNNSNTGGEQGKDESNKEQKAKTTSDPGVPTGDAKKDAEQAQKILARGISAHGGTGPLDRVPTMVRSATGTMIFNNVAQACSSELYCDLPGRFRLDIESGQQKQRISIVVGPKEGWMVVGGVTTDQHPQQLRDLQRAGYALYVSSLVPIRDRSGFSYKLIPGITVWDKPTDGIVVSRQDQEDLNLYFDRQTGYLVQIQTRTSVSGLVTKQDFLFGEFKEFQGAMLPTHYIEQFNGEKSAEFKTARYSFPAKPDEKQFGKP